MTINSNFRNGSYSTDQTALDVGRLLGRRDMMTTRERHEPVKTTPTRSLEELYPSLFDEPGLLPQLSRAATAAVDALTAAVRLLRRRVLRQRAARGRSARRA